jgi:hypothetical protein
MSYDASGSDVVKVIVKGGPSYEVYDKAPFNNVKAPVNEKNNKNYAISHVIVCKVIRLLHSQLYQLSQQSQKLNLLSLKNQQKRTKRLQFVTLHQARLTLTLKLLLVKML